MNEPNSRGETIIMAEDNGEVTILKPLEDWDARRTPAERQALDNYLKRTRKLYGRNSASIEMPLAENSDGQS